MPQFGLEDLLVQLDEQDLQAHLSSLLAEAVKFLETKEDVGEPVGQCHYPYSPVRVTP